MRRIKLAISSIWLLLPAEFSKFRIGYYNKRGCKIHNRTSISPNVRIKGKFEMDEGSSIAQNCSISGENVGVSIGKNVMIAPNVVIVAFSHGIEHNGIPMVNQEYVEDKIIIEDDVWIASNCTISKGVVIGKGAVVGANSFVNKNIEPYSVVGGVPAMLIKFRNV